MSRLPVAVAAIATLCVIAALGQEPRKNAALPNACWPRFRGIDGCGVAGPGTLPTKWSSTQNVMWKTPIPGKGWGSPVVWGSSVFITAAVTAAPAEPPVASADDNTNRNGVKADKEHRWTLVCLDLKSGRVRWMREAHRAVPDWAINPKGSYANESAATDGERVVATFGNVGVYCYSMSGKPLWSRTWGKKRMLFNWGHAASPVILDGRVYVQNDNEEGSFLTALDARTGREVWKVDRKEYSSWSTPLAWKVDGKTQIVLSGSRRAAAYGVDGAQLWELNALSVATIPAPFAFGGLAFVASGHASGPVRPIYAIRPSASGDITLPKDQKKSDAIPWSEPMAGPYVPTPLAMGGHVYSLTDVSGLFCYVLETGAQVYGRKRFGPGGEQFTASPVAGDGKLYCLGEKGDTFVVQAGPEFSVLARNSLGEPTLSTPALVDGSILIRTLTSLYRIGARK